MLAGATDTAQAVADLQAALGPAFGVEVALLHLLDSQGQPQLRAGAGNRDAPVQLSLPLRVDGHVAGTLSFGRSTGGGFAAGEQALLGAIAQCLAAAHQRIGAEPQRRDNELFVQLAQQATDAIICIDSGQRITRFNRGAEQIFGYESAEMLGQPLTSLLPVAAAAKHAAHVAAFGAQPNAVRRMGERGRIFGRRRNGSEFAAEASISRIDLAGELVYTVVLRDISEALQLEATLRQSEARLKTIYDSASEYIGLLDTDGNLLDANHAALALLDLRLETVMGRPFWETPWWNHAPALQQQLRQAIAQAARGDPARFEAQHPTHGGEMVDVEFSLTPVRDADGRVTALLPEGRDITARKQAERELERNRSRLAFIVANSPDHVFIQDRDLRYEWVSRPPPPFNASQFIGRTDLDLAELAGTDGEAARRVMAVKRSVLATGCKQSMDMELSVNGRVRHYEATFEPLRDAAGQIIGLLGFARDDTERVETLLELRRAKEAAEAASQAKSRFLAVASHDLRQPLQTAGLLAGSLSRLLRDPQLLEIIERQQHALGSAAGLLDTLLDLTRLESGALQPRIEAVALGPLFDQLREELNEDARQRQITLSVAQSTCRVRSDRLLLRQILQNLLTNALRYTPAGGRVSLSACESQGSVRIEVRDTGVGIPAQELARIFDEFYQVKGDRTPGDRTERKGWGLGLSIVRQAAHLLGHPIEVQSEVARGTVFTLTAPEVEPDEAVLAPAAPTTAAPVRRAAGRHAVLLIDDDEAVLSATGLLLRVDGFSVHAARSLGDVERLLADPEFKPDAIVSDVHLGDQQAGPELVGLVRRRLQRPLPAILMSGDTSPRRAGYEDLADVQYMSKPVDPDRLLATLHSLTG